MLEDQRSGVGKTSLLEENTTQGQKEIRGSGKRLCKGPGVGAAWGLGKPLMPGFCGCSHLRKDAQGEGVRAESKPDLKPQAGGPLLLEPEPAVLLGRQAGLEVPFLIQGPFLARLRVPRAKSH